MQAICLERLEAQSIDIIGKVENFGGVDERVWDETAQKKGREVYLIGKIRK